MQRLPQGGRWCIGRTAELEKRMWLPVGIAAGIIGVLATIVADWRRSGRVPHLAAAAQPRGRPRVSLLIPARNEARVIEGAVRAAMAQRYQPLEVLVLDDHSTDATPQILEQLQHEYPQLRVLAGRPMPDGWAGKPHACQQLSTAARGEWLLFLDADTQAAPDLTAAMLAHAEQHSADVVTVFPFQELGSRAERLVLPPFLGMITVLYPLERVLAEDARPDEVMANGQCILVRRSSYDAIGGHGAVKCEILEDVLLAQALRRGGARISGAAALDLLQVRMYTNAAEVINGLMKHASAGFRASGSGRALWVMTRQMLQAWGPFWLLAGAIAAASNGFPWLIVPVLITFGAAGALWGRLYRRFYRLSGWYGLLWPLGLLSYFLIAGVGVLRVAIGLGVTWRDRVYKR
jgi:chlorobactene glucosyltransferase